MVIAWNIHTDIFQIMLSGPDNMNTGFSFHTLYIPLPRYVVMDFA